MNCPDCGGEMWDNRENKKNPKAPDFKCKDKSCGGVIWPPKKGDVLHKSSKSEPEPGEQFRQTRETMQSGSGIDEARKHLMQSANLLNLCIDCVEKTVWPHLVAYSQKEHSDWLTCELYNATIAKLYIEASGRRTDDGKHWWSYIDKMPEHPLK